MLRAALEESQPQAALVALSSVGRAAWQSPLSDLRLAERGGMPCKAINTNIADSLNVMIRVERRRIRYVSEVIEMCEFDPGAGRNEFRSIYARDVALSSG